MCVAVHIYLCDDAPADHKEDYQGESYLAVTLHQELIDQLYKIHGIPVIRVRRDKGKGEANPKSANLNSCLRKIYGDDVAPPEMEVVAVFDADQAAHSHFFTSTLPWMDAGDDVAVVQSPQVCFICSLLRPFCVPALQRLPCPSCSGQHHCGSKSEQLQSYSEHTASDFAQQSVHVKVQGLACWHEHNAS